MAETRGQFVQAKIHPNHLHSNSTSHTWPFSAMAELIDNAYDPDVEASELHIDIRKINGKDCLTVTDNGNGMDVDHLEKMLSLGFCEKEQYEKAEGPRARKPIGRFGNGFKSGSMRLAKDALVFTVSEESETGSIGFLSQTLCKEHNYDTLILPIMEYQFRDQDLVRTPQNNMDHSLVAILDVSPYNDEDALKEELWTLKREGQHRGTKIVLFNLKRNKAGQFELDFVSDPEDIRNPETHESEQSSSQEQDTGFKFRQSLRAYCSILYLAPKLTIFIRGKKVKTQSLKGTLKSPEKYSYKPKKSGKGTDITFGYRRRGAEDMLEDYGIMFYHRNRLIEPYVKLKSQPPTSSSHECEVSGVIDVGEVLEPTHTKQEFQKNTTQYRSMMRALDEKLKEYLGRTSQSDEEEEEWLTCCQCRKNRKLTQSDASKFRENFCCRLNPDMSKNRCDIPEEPSADADRPTAGNRPERQGQGNRRGRSRGNTSEESTARRSTAESVDEDEQGPSSTSGVTTPSTSTATKRKSATPSRPPSSKRPRTATRSPSLEPAVAEPTAEPDAQVSPSQPQPRIIPVREHTRTIGATGPEEQSLERVVARATKQIAKSVFKNTARPRSSPSSESNTAASTSRSGNATVEGTHSGATASTSQAAGNIGNAAASTSRSGNATVEGTHSGATASTSQAAGNIGNVAASTSRSGNATVEGTHSGATASASQAAGNSSDTASSSTSSGATSSSNPQAATSNTNSTSGINRSATESANSSNVCNTGDSAGHEQAQRQLRKFKESVFKLLGLIIPYVNLGDLPGQGSEEEIETTVENMIKYIERQQN